MMIDSYASNVGRVTGEVKRIVFKGLVQRLTGGYVKPVNGAQRLSTLLPG